MQEDVRNVRSGRLATAVLSTTSATVACAHRAADDGLQLLLVFEWMFVRHPVQWLQLHARELSNMGDAALLAASAVASGTATDAAAADAIHLRSAIGDAAGGHCGALQWTVRRLQGSRQLLHYEYADTQPAGAHGW